jgi:hypothetical protein
MSRFPASAFHRVLRNLPIQQLWRNQTSGRLNQRTKESVRWTTTDSRVLEEVERIRAKIWEGKPGGNLELHFFRSSTLTN